MADIDEYVAQMKREADEAGRGRVSWREGTDLIVNCERLDDGTYQWGTVDDRNIRRKCSEKTARKHIREMGLLASSEKKST